jgi:AraC-like DNA-binding protein/signal transduction histidine kinase/CheY-like chemotaxis protein
MRISLVLVFYCLFNLFFASAKEFSFRTLGPQQGMSQASAVTFLQDKWGRIWIGNDVVNCFDGENVYIFRLSEYFSAVEDINIHSFCGGDSILFLLADDDLICLNLYTDKIISPGIKSTAIASNDNNCFFATDNYISKYNFFTNSVNKLFELPADISISLLYLHDGKILLGTSDGLMILEKKNNGEYSLSEKYFDNYEITALFVDSQNTLWIGVNNKFVYCIRKDKNIIQLKDSENNNFIGNVFSFTESKATNTIWMGTITGAYSFPIDKPVVVSKPMFQNSMIYALFTDRQENLWIGSYYGVVRYFNPLTDNFSFWKSDEQRNDRLHGVILGSMEEDKKNNLFIATEESGINVLHLKTGDIKHINTKTHDIPNDKIRAIKYDSERDALIISCFLEGLYLLDCRTNKVTKIKSEILNTRLKRVIEQIIPYENYYVLSTQDGIFSFDIKSLHIKPLFDDVELDNLCSGFKRTVYIDDRGVLWVSSYEKGLFTIDIPNKKFLRQYGKRLEESSVIHSPVISIVGNMKQGLYFVTSKSGLLNYNFADDTFQIVATKDNWLLSDFCYNIVMTNKHNIIVSSNLGVSLLKLSSDNKIESSWHISLNDSYLISEISYDCGLFFSPSTEEIFVGGLYGMFSFIEKEMYRPNNNYSLYLSSLFVNNEKINKGNLAELTNLSLPYNKNTLSFAFASSNYTPSYHAIYQYKLEDMDSYWNMTEHKTINYSSLRPGKYRLIIKEMANPEKIMSINIRIKSPIWLSWYAFVFYVLLTILVIRAIWYFYKERAILSAKLEMERREIDRMEEINRNQVNFFTSISNEYRTPLTLIISLSFNLLQELSGIRKSKMIQINKQAYYLKNLIADFIDLQKLGWNKLNLKVDSYSYLEFVQDTCQGFSFYMQGRTFIYPKQDEETIVLWYDKNQIQKVLYNLLNIAFHLVDAKDKIVVSVQRKSNLVETFISCYYNSTNRILKDNIVEIINEEKSAEIDIFSLHGNNIGLTLSKKIVELHNGEINVVESDNSLTISFQLPLGEKHFKNSDFAGNIDVEMFSSFIGNDERYGEDEPVENVANEYVHAKKYNLYLIINNDELSDLLKQFFSPTYDIVVKNNTIEVFEAILTEIPDLIIIDMSISQPSSLELCKTIKSNSKTMHIPVVMLSSNTSDIVQFEALKAGVDDYYVKPFNGNILFLRSNRLVVRRGMVLETLNVSNIEDSSFSQMAIGNQNIEFLDSATKILFDNMDNSDFDTVFWSRHLGVGRTLLFNKIKSITGMTPNDYIMSVKIGQAKKYLMEKSGMTIYEIAYSVGFSSPAYFSKCFKKNTGLTPQQYKNKQRTN